MGWRGTVLESVLYWETGRLGYNAVLAALVFAVATVTDGWIGIGRQWPAIVMLGAVANALYCTVYPLDLIAQATPLAGVWRHARPVVWVLGAAFATLIALAFLRGFANGGALP